MKLSGIYEEVFLMDLSMTVIMLLFINLIATAVILWWSIISKFIDVIHIRRLKALRVRKYAGNARGSRTNSPVILLITGTLTAISITDYTRAVGDIILRLAYGVRKARRKTGG